jgi:DUF971 family protein
MANTNKSESDRIFPKAIQKHSSTHFRILWTSGDSSILSYKTLRFHCRCAECVDEWTQVRKISEESIASDIRPLEVGTIGRYAVAVRWSDGHNTGIYPFDVLQKLSESGGQ